MPPRKPSLHPSVSDIALALAQRPRSEPVSTVSLSRNAAGQTQITVDVDDTDVRGAAKVATLVFDALCKKYPRTDPETGKAQKVVHVHPRRAAS